MDMVTRVAVVTDSTASIPADVADDLPLVQVPLQVVIDGHSRPEFGDPAMSREIADALRDGRSVSTSKSNPEIFTQTYQRLFAEDVDQVVSVHLSGAMSGTCDAALQAARGFGERVHVMDSRTIAMACGYAAISGARLAQEAALDTGSAAVDRDDRDTAQRVVQLIHNRIQHSEIYFSVASLEYLRRGGRIGAAATLVGSSLAIKPLLRMADGVISPYERVRTTTRAHARLIQLAADAVHRADGAADVAVHHLDDLSSAQQVAESLGDLARPDSLVISEVSSVLGVHVGPGTVGVVVSPRVSH